MNARDDVYVAMRAVFEAAMDAAMTEAEIVDMARQVARDVSATRTQAAAARLYGNQSASIPREGSQ